MADTTMYHTYILRSRSSGRFYIGQTDDLDARVARHNSGGCDATRGRGPWELVWSQSFATRSEAVRMERGIKSRKSREFIEALIAKGSDPIGSRDCG